MVASPALAEGKESRRTLGGRREAALISCDEQVDFFPRASRKAHWLYAASEIITIVVSAAIPVILLVDSTIFPSWLEVDMSTKAFVALLSSLVAISSGMAGTFHWQEQWVRTAFFRQQLISERAKFETGAGEYGKARSEQDAIDAFVTRTEDIRMAEAGQWRERVMKVVNPATSDTDQQPDSAK